MQNHAIILAGGSGNRMDAELPKQLLKIKGIPVIIHTLKNFENCQSIDTLTIVSHKNYCQTIIKLCHQYSISKCINVIAGGANRQSSSYIGVMSLHADPNDNVLIHDAARPIVSRALIESVINTLKECDAASTAIASTDTIYITKEQSIISVPDRTTLFNAQTPQAFKFKVIEAAHVQALRLKITNASDDTVLVLKAGYLVKLVKGDDSNIKITTKKDLQLAESLLTNETHHHS